MGLFNFFKKKHSEDTQVERLKTNSADNNLYLLETLRNKLIEDGYLVEKHPQYLKLIVNDEIEIATVIIDNPNNHPSILHLMILTIHPEYFPNGIEENIVGIGTVLKDKVDSVINNYISTTFKTIIKSFSNEHDQDFYAIANNKKELWHINLGNPGLQGQWNEQPQNEDFFDIIRDKVKDKLTSNKINWLKLYISKRKDGTIIGECRFNNEHWEEGLDDITEYAKSWKIQTEFQGLKQFIVFKRCDFYN